MTAKLLKFPYSRIRQEDERHEAKILKLPEKPIDPLMVMPMLFSAWLGMFQP